MIIVKKIKITPVSASAYSVSIHCWGFSELIAHLNKFNWVLFKQVYQLLKGPTFQVPAAAEVPNHWAMDLYLAINGLVLVHKEKNKN